MVKGNETLSAIFRSPQPTKVKRSELQRLIALLEAQDGSLTKFRDEISRHPVALKAILRAANSSLTGSAVVITEPAHAALYLGSRRVSFLLNTLAPEVIEEDMEAPIASPVP